MISDHHIIYIDQKAVFVTVGSLADAQERVKLLQEAYNRQHNIKSSWQNAKKVHIVSVPGDGTKIKQFDAPAMQQIEVKNENIDN